MLSDLAQNHLGPLDGPMPRGGPTDDLLYVDLPELVGLLDRKAVLETVRQAFIDHADGRFTQVDPVHLIFPAGDCHIKSGFRQDAALFTIKVATGFHGNARLGLPNANGLMLLCSQLTGAPVALVMDRGMMTAWRTVAATVLAARVLAPPAPIRLGVVGAGLQARLAIEWAREEMEIEETLVWARSDDAVARLVSDAGGEVRRARSAKELCKSANLIVTATAATTPVVEAEWIRPGTHIVAIGADTPGKLEIDPVLFSKAGVVLTDDHAQCLDHGDFGAAVRAGCIAAESDTALATALRDEGVVGRDPHAITIADLTGMAAQDDAIATLFLDRISAPRR